MTRMLNIVRSLLLVGLGAALLPCSICRGAFIVVAPDDGKAAVGALAVSASGATGLTADGGLVAIDLPADIRPRTGCWLGGVGYVLFDDLSARLRSADALASWRPLPGSPRRVHRASCVDETHLLLLYGGVAGPEGLRGAQVGICGLTGGPSLGPVDIGVKPEANPRFLAVGELDDGPHALVGVLTVAVFDPHFHLRPWLYSLAGDRMTPAWLGTSLARPYITAGFADVDPANAGDELCSIELDADGRRLLTAYRRHGFVMEGVAQGAAGTLGDTLRTARLGPGEDLVCVWVGDAIGRIVGHRRRPTVDGELGLLEPLVATGLLPRPAAWDVVVDRGRPYALTACTQGVLARIPMLRQPGTAVAIGPQSAL